jgi:hypothetical protein
LPEVSDDTTTPAVVDALIIDVINTFLQQIC